MGQCCQCRLEGRQCGYCMADDINRINKVPPIPPERRSISVMVKGVKACDLYVTEFTVTDKHQEGTYEILIRGIIPKERGREAVDSSDPPPELISVAEALQSLFYPSAHLDVPFPNCPRCGSNVR